MVWPGPVMAKFSIALREISTHKELLRSQVIVCQLLQSLSYFFKRFCGNSGRKNRSSAYCCPDYTWCGFVGGAYAKWPVNEHP